VLLPTASSRSSSPGGACVVLLDRNCRASGPSIALIPGIADTVGSVPGSIGSACRDIDGHCAGQSCGIAGLISCAVRERCRTRYFGIYAAADSDINRAIHSIVCADSIQGIIGTAKWDLSTLCHTADDGRIAILVSDFLGEYGGMLIGYRLIDQCIGNSHFG
jgi:hypothetical protein